MAPDIKVAIIGGTGLDDPDILKNRREKRVTTPFGAPSDSLLLGEIDGVECVLLARHGRKHDVAPGHINYRANIWALKQEGCTHILASNACGSLREDIPPGDLVIIDSFLDRTTNRIQSFYGSGPDSLPGLCHIPMEPAFCPQTRKVLLETASKLGLKVHNGGTVVAIEGPRYSSKAESNLYRQWGAHLVGMTTVPEVVLAKEAGLCYGVIALSTDYDCWRDSGEKVSHQFVVKNFQENVKKVTSLLLAAVSRLKGEDWTRTLQDTQNLAKESVMPPNEQRDSKGDDKCSLECQKAK
ncbi:S-methyl-5'-thioadenosine phosphorylase [Cylas formicarius]|uniref:S-methyl-5'-thioadenosine phosphorylase n=1 Tax=Cylas formicarius TaxID=197179 RepID=UPI002958B524|nr:S-methyl-5'-thioadenosine phosphorylase [Cylas formicarius]